MEKNGIGLEQTMKEALEVIDGLKDRVCPVVDIQKSTGPLAVYDQRGENEQKALTGGSGLLTAEYQIHVLHNTYFKMRQLAEQVKATMQALEGAAHLPLLIETVNVELGSPDILESKVQMFRRTYNVTFQYQIKED